MSKIKSILLIDDDPGINDYHKIIINKTGITDHIHICTDGQDAMDYLTNQGEYIKYDIYPSPELIFLDINMPGMNGFEFLEAYQNLNKSQKGNQVIIMLTTSLNEDDKTKALSYPSVSSFLNKPLSKKIINELVISYF